MTADILMPFVRWVILAPPDKPPPIWLDALHRALHKLELHNSFHSDKKNYCPPPASKERNIYYE